MPRKRGAKATQPSTTPRDTRQGLSARIELLTPGEQMSVPSERVTGSPLSRSTGSATSNVTGTTSPATYTGHPLSFTPNATQSTVPIPWSQTPTPGPGTQPATQASTMVPNESQAMSTVVPSQSQATETGNSQSQKLTWTPAMEKSALDLYVQAVEDGKRSEAGFKPEVHRWVASELLAEFPGNDFTEKKTFKKWYDAFLACKGASGFGWNEEQCMVTASEDVWSSFLVSHPMAKRFKNTPFPEFHELNIIFSGNAATGALRRGAAAEEGFDERGEPGDYQGNGADDRNEGPENREPAAAGDSDQAIRSRRARPGVRPRRSHRVTSGDRFESSIKRLVDAFIASQDNSVGGEVSRIELACAKFQDSFAGNLEMEELVAGFSVLEHEAKANTFLAIRSHEHCSAWLNWQIELHLAAQRD
ncbi:hypothetical protein MJO29_003465 [Puccinia striiformis f. sp. tritici]|uniref:hypothetical protein n=1 Tax=Puccinia striiformis f. sp. tritici TaxID=168172 RepID=UPI0020073E94|nr:hypothetical protein Pst134EA_004674 [Puccinia striiformis f. sp. tritici]KAH9470749.1 hypothetical protein Pst134EA_004674 [Puccinia striiformis f. sp. tritici]KAI7965367.1 hypothetical protein MJO29_003465 [Puccinia striiformis f. sp. tritici]